MDANPPLPCLLAAFSPGDAVVGCFDDEAQTAMETTPHPNLIIPLQLSDPAVYVRVSGRWASHVRHWPRQAD